ncbi:hypothetical protein [Demequina salsinemoris]|uniref:hypothetical protein n=1 Tax=Demequina salsinemoris TaxID=577470 RepID=UPI000784D3B9|nr:hypothetical protein [Demequina salsinemoris]
MTSRFDVGPLPDGTTLLHIGAPKTATSALQSALTNANEQLLDLGVRVPLGQGNHNQLVRHLAYGKAEADGFALVRRMHEEFEQDSRLRVVSSELCSQMTIKKGRAVYDSLPGPVHVVLTLRNFADLLPSQWQQRVKLGETRTLDEWLDEVLDDPESLDLSPVPAYHQRDNRWLLSRWIEIAGAENVTVAVLDRSDRRSVYRIFEHLLGLEDGLLEGDNLNESLSAAEAEFLRSFNIAAEHLPRNQRYMKVVDRGIARAIRQYQGELPPSAPVAIPEAYVDPASRAGRAFADAVTATGVRVMGDLGELSAPPRRVGATADSTWDHLPVGVAAEMVRDLFIEGNSELFAEVTDFDARLSADRMNRTSGAQPAREESAAPAGSGGRTGSSGGEADPVAAGTRVASAAQAIPSLASRVVARALRTLLPRTRPEATRGVRIAPSGTVLTDLVSGAPEDRRVRDLWTRSARVWRRARDTHRIGAGVLESSSALESASRRWLAALGRGGRLTFDGWLAGGGRDAGMVLGAMVRALGRGTVTLESTPLGVEPAAALARCEMARRANELLGNAKGPAFSRPRVLGHVLPEALDRVPASEATLRSLARADAKVERLVKRGAVRDARVSIKPLGTARTPESISAADALPLLVAIVEDMVVD